jgi:GT2 family glycosyltransferase
MNNNFVYIIILNWNGWRDTIDCLNSLKKTNYSYYHIILLDNGSTNDSVNQIRSWINANDISPKLNLVDYDKIIYSSEWISFLTHKENLGFSKGCNFGIDFADSQFKGNLVLLLNNDTTVEFDFLDKLISVYKENQYSVLAPQIRLYEPKELIWNCGGKLFFGFRKYYFQGKHISNLPKKDILEVTFLTGCALLFNFKKTGKLTDRFFFGEEDFEFSYRLKLRKEKMACVLNSIIYHKVGRSISSHVQENFGPIYIYYLNRFINMKYIFDSKLVWGFWIFIYSFYLFYLFILKNKMKISKYCKFYFILLKNSNQLSEVNQAHFNWAREYFST